MIKTALRRRLFIGAIIFAPPLSSAQIDNFKSQYENFKKQAKAEYEDLRAQCNAEYAEFVKEGWKEYKILPAIPRPKDETIPPIIRPNKDKGKKMADKTITIKDFASPIKQTPQPKPVSLFTKENNKPKKHFILHIVERNVAFASLLLIISFWTFVTISISPKYGRNYQQTNSTIPTETSLR